jgi:hypothetical protein
MLADSADERSAPSVSYPPRRCAQKDRGAHPLSSSILSSNRTISPRLMLSICRAPNF